MQDESYARVTAKVIWHEQKIEQIAVARHELQPIRFQGQMIDSETGLHYNRFRYFDPDVGMFISRDPIGLMGGNNVFAYAPNPTGWIDPWGLNKQKGSCTKPATRQEVINNTRSVVKMHESIIKAIDPNARVGIRGSTATGFSGHKNKSWSSSSGIDALHSF